MFKGRVEFLGDGVEDGWVSVGSIAQRLEQGTHNPLVEGSNPSGPNLSHCWTNRQACDLAL